MISILYMINNEHSPDCSINEINGVLELKVENRSLYVGVSDMKINK